MPFSCASLQSVMLSLDTGDQAAIDADDRAGDVRGAFTGEKRNRGSILFRFTVAAQGNAARALSCYVFYAAPLALGLRFVEKFDSIGRYAARQNNVRRDAVLAHFPRKSLGPT